MRRLARGLGLLVALGLVFGVGWAWPILVRPPLVVGQDAITSAASARVTPVVETAGGANTTVVAPPDGIAAKDTLVIVYPGGLVRPQAYEWLARALAVRGYLTVIPEFSFDLAVTNPGRAGALIERYADGRRVVLVGHSLGGAMAAQYLAEELRAGRQPASGLVLLAAYPPDGSDLTSAGLTALSLRAANDLVADRAKVADGLSRLPYRTRLVEVDGAVHSFFGRYGPQAGDGVPSVSRSAAEEQIIEALASFLATVQR